MWATPGKGKEVEFETETGRNAYPMMNDDDDDYDDDNGGGGVFVSWKKDRGSIKATIVTFGIGGMVSTSDMLTRL